MDAYDRVILGIITLCLVVIAGSQFIQMGIMLNLSEVAQESAEISLKMLKNMGV